MSALSIVGVTLVGVFTVFILMKKNKRGGDYMLAIMNVFLCLSIIAEGWVFDGEVLGIELFLHFNANFWFVSFFFGFAYSVVLNKGRIQLKWWYFAFSAPFLVFSFVDMFLIGEKTPTDYQQIMEHPHLVYHFFFKLHKVFIILVGLDILRNIRKYNDTLKQWFSSTESISLDWLRNYTRLIILLYAIHLVVFLMYNFQIIPEIDIAYLVTGVIIVFGVIYLSFHGIRQYNYQTVERAEKEQIPEIVASVSQDKKSDESERICNQMIRLFDEEEVFVNPELRIANVAEVLEIPVHKLSQAINDHYKKPFYDVVAQYRVASLKEKLVNAENKSFTILALALDSGFNSKASLNRIFKEHTGMTPSQFQKSHFTK